MTETSDDPAPDVRDLMAALIDLVERPEWMSKQLIDTVITRWPDVARDLIYELAAREMSARRREARQTKQAAKAVKGPQPADGTNTERRHHAPLLSDPSPLFVSPADAAKMLGIGRVEVFRLIDIGGKLSPDAPRLESCKAGRRRLISTASVDALANRLMAAANAVGANLDADGDVVGA